MELKSWAMIQKLKDSEVAKVLGISQSHVHKYLYEKSIPKPKLMRRIFIVTLGAVTANDFYELNAELIEKELLKK